MQILFWRLKDRKCLYVALLLQIRDPLSTGPTSHVLASTFTIFVLLSFAVLLTYELPVVLPLTTYSEICYQIYQSQYPNRAIVSSIWKTLSLPIYLRRSARTLGSRMLGSTVLCRGGSFRREDCPRKLNTSIIWNCCPIKIKIYYSPFV